LSSEVVSLAREEFQRERCLFGSVARFRRRLELGYGIKAQRFIASLYSSAFPMGWGSCLERREGMEPAHFQFARPKRRGRRREIQPNLAFAFQPLASDALQPRIGGIQRTFDHLVDALAETFVVESHALSQRAE
jgi:hypothetical protein